MLYDIALEWKYSVNKNACQVFLAPFLAQLCKRWQMGKLSLYLYFQKLLIMFTTWRLCRCMFVSDKIKPIGALYEENRNHILKIALRDIRKLYQRCNWNLLFFLQSSKEISIKLLFTKISLSKSKKCQNGHANAFVCKQL